MTFPTRKPADYDASEKRSIGKGLFRKCDGCGQTLSAEQMIANFEVCPLCQQHHQIGLAAQLLGIELMKGSEVELRDEIDEEEDQVVFRERVAR